MLPFAFRVPCRGALLATVLLTSCGGGGGDGAALAPPPAPLPTLRVSTASPFTADCGGSGQVGVLFRNAEVEPYLAVNPSNPLHLIGVWQQDRWSNGGAQGLLTGVSTDGGQTWSQRSAKFSHCTGGTAANGGDYERASDPWLSYAPNGVAYQVALGLSGVAKTTGTANAILVSRSSDGGLSWDAPLSLIRDGAAFFNDKETVTADSADPRFAYVVWDRLDSNNSARTYFARTSDGGQTWEAARPIYDPGASSQSIANQIVVLPGGLLVNLYTRIDAAANGSLTASLAVIRSADHGDTWSAPIKVADLLAVGASDPETGKGIRDGAFLAGIAVDAAGTMAAVWQDARYSGGQRDGVVLSRSTDSGLTWTAPVRVNGDPAVQAFTPSVHVRGDGVIGVSYFDLRSNTADAATLLTDYWLARSSDGLNWSETRLSGPFNLNTAPDADGLFLGDYQGLKSSGQSFVALFVQTTGDATNRNDVFAVLPANTTTLAKTAQAVAQPPATPANSADFARRVQENLARKLERPPHQRALLKRRSSRAR